MKYLLLLLVVGIGLYLLLGRNRTRPPPQAPPTTPRPKALPAAMLACAHCGLHLPRDDALFDAEGRAYCGEPHRVAGPQ